MAHGTRGGPDGRTVATMVPSATDLVVALGAADRIIGISHECDHPAVTGRPILTRSAVPGAPDPGRAAADPAALDAAVSAARAADAPLYLTDRAALHRLAPGVVVAQDVCDVCAVTGDQVACEVPEGTEVVRLGAVDLNGLRTDLRTVGRALGGEGPDRAEAAIAALDDGLAAVRATVAGQPRPRALLLEWGDPPFVAGHWVPELLEVAGGIDALGAPGAPSRRVSWDEVATADPDVIVFLPCGYDLDAATHEGRALLARPELTGLRAVAEGRTWATDATRVFSRCTPVAVQAARVLASILHPEVAGPVDPRAARRLGPEQT
ncbi:ABC transporter substrate-binding protein [Iamia sp.]|uniref:ABC transporter substrate-binding protein n=1 Tax=Iamia sp. TaxID=2722710 RepID=UPI002B59826F|nr:ABC transporter substrate-binding protein [Iamia sp.]HXH59175.1 ABC transporter substrate-binding protein [Iamia sp.]